MSTPQEQKISELLFRDPTRKEARRWMARRSLGDEGLNGTRKISWGCCAICGKKAHRIEDVLCESHSHLPKRKYVTSLRISIKKWKFWKRKGELASRGPKISLQNSARSVIRSATFFYLKMMAK